MFWRASEFDPTSDNPRRTCSPSSEPRGLPGSPTVDCYRAGVGAWRRAHPDQRPEYAARQAGAVILAARITLSIEKGA